MKSTLSILMLIAALLLSGCGDRIWDALVGSNDGTSTTAIAGPDPRLAKDPVDQRLVDGNTALAIDLLRQLSSDKADTNVFISPASVSLALFMTYNGAGTTTAEQMATALHVDGMTLDELNAAAKVLLSNLVYGDEEVTLRIANSLWGRQDIAFSPDFVNRNWDYYAAKITAMDFAAPGALETINGWIEDNTAGRIVDMLDEIPGNAALYLINAIYFKADWTLPFDSTKTAAGTFTRSDGSTPSVKLMEQTESFSYLETADFQAVSLPYGTDERFSMYAFLPSESTGMAGFLPTLTPANWSAWMDGFAKKMGTVVVPKFSMRWKKLMNDDLKALGMVAPFGASADFRSMTTTDHSLAISRVIHETFLGIDEIGTEATGVTIVEMRDFAPMPEFEVRLDRPFLIVIRDNTTGTLLFMGVIADPTAS